MNGDARNGRENVQKGSFPGLVILFDILCTMRECGSIKCLIQMVMDDHTVAD